MAKRNKLWAKKKRAEIVRALGGKCKVCGATEELEIHHIFGRKYDLELIGSDSRVSRYIKELRAGLIDVLCRSCNAKIGMPEPEETLFESSDNVPF